MENLPIDIIQDILSRLSIESTLQSKRVCKTWRNLIGENETGLLFAYTNINNLLADHHAKVKLYYGNQCEGNLKQYYSTKTLTKLDGVKYCLRIPDWSDYHHMVGSCNGLVCLLYSRNRGGICNPVTGEFLTLPGLREPSFGGRTEVGFGYLPSTKEYKVIRCRTNFLNGKAQGHVEVYTLGSESGWRGKENIPYIFHSSGLFFNGAIHWIGEIGRGHFVYKVYKLIVYDLADEKFKSVTSLPFDYEPDGRNKLALLRGNLCAINHSFTGGRIVIWAYKKRTENVRMLRPRREAYYDHNWSWSKEFSIRLKGPKKYNYRPFAITESNKVLLWFENKKLYSYDNSTSTLTKLWNGNRNGFTCLEAIPHMNTLVSLKDLGEFSAGNSVTSDNGESLGSKISKQRKKRKCDHQAG